MSENTGYYRRRMDPSDPTACGSYFDQTTAPNDTECGTCKTPIAKGVACHAVYVSIEHRKLLGYRCTKSVCIDGEPVPADELPPGLEPIRMGMLHLMDDDRLRIRLTNVSVDSIKNGGARVSFEVFSSLLGHKTAPLTLIVEAPRFRTACAGEIPPHDYERIIAEATARLREDLQAMIEALDVMEEHVRLNGLTSLVPPDVR